MSTTRFAAYVNWWSIDNIMISACNCELSFVMVLNLISQLYTGIDVHVLELYMLFKICPISFLASKAK